MTHVTNAQQQRLTMHDRNGCAPKTGTCCGKDYFCYQGNLCCVDQEGDNYCNAQCVETLILDRNDYNDPTFDEV